MTFAIEDFYGSEGGRRLIDREVPHAFIQYKGTDICMDFYCPCGEGGHFDGDFAYVVECPACHRRWEMAWHVLAREAKPGDWHYDNAKMLDND